jgi:UDP-N-acetylglucosamine enolpyruvyl transferase
VTKNLNANFVTSQATVGATATLIVAQRSGRDTVVIENTGTTPVYLGNSAVTVSNGLLLPGVLGASVAIETTDAVYGVVPSGTQVVCAIENF